MEDEEELQELRNQSFYSQSHMKRKRESKVIEEVEEENDFIGPHPVITNDINENQNGDHLSDDNYQIPFSHEIQLKGHARAVSSVALDRAGGRLLTGSYDSFIKFWDFAGMDSSFRNFREIEVAEGSQIKSIQFSATGDCFLVAPSNSQAKIYDRDGFEQGECIKGDMYLIDMAHTRGHTSTLGNATWNPINKDLFMTCALDGTVRIWDCNRMTTKQNQVIKIKPKNGKRIGVTRCCYNIDGKSIFAGCQDGTIQMWSSSAPFNRAQKIVEAHLPGSDITGLTLSTDMHTLISRSIDDTLKVWDTRKFNSPLKVFEGLINSGNTDCIFSPDNELILTGTSVRKEDEASGLLIFIDKTLLTKVNHIGIEKGSSVLSMAWHPLINQIVVGTSSGNAHVLYDPELSVKGALLSIVRTPRTKNPSDFEPPRPIQTPHALPMFYETANSKRKEARARFDPRKTAKPGTPAAPHVPEALEGPGRGGRIGSSVTQHLMKNFIRKDTSRDEDPREALLKYHEAAEKNPYFFGVYKKTQPEPKFDYSKLEEEESPVVKPAKKD